MNAKQRRQHARGILADEETHARQLRALESRLADVLDAAATAEAGLAEARTWGDQVAVIAAELAGSLVEADAWVRELIPALGRMVERCGRALQRVEVLNAELAAERRSHEGFVPLGVATELEATVRRLQAEDHDAAKLRRRLAERGHELAAAQARIHQLEADARAAVQKRAVIWTREEARRG